MKFGVREICDVVFKANQNVKIGGTEFSKGEPVLYIDSAKTSTIEGAATTVYATGGRGNSRLIAWEGEKTLTFTVEDALLSPMGFAILSGAGLFDLSGKTALVHCTAEALIASDRTVEVEDKISTKAPIFVALMENGSFVKKISGLTTAATRGRAAEATTDGDSVYQASLPCTKISGFESSDVNKTVFIDYYVEKTTGVTEIQIDASHFAGYYYVEASTLFRREQDGKDLPAEIVFPRVKVQSNFTFTMASSGDPSTFTFTMDAFPGYTMFDKAQKVLCAMQIINEEDTTIKDQRPVTEYESDQGVTENDTDSIDRTKQII